MTVKTNAVEITNVLINICMNISSNNIMERCWMKEPSERPSFTELKESLNELYQKAQPNTPKNNSTISIDHA